MYRRPRLWGAYMYYWQIGELVMCVPTHGYSTSYVSGSEWPGADRYSAVHISTGFRAPHRCGIPTLFVRPNGWLAGWTDRSNGWQDGWMDGRASRCRSGSASPYQSVTVATAAPCRTIAAQRAQAGLTQAGHSQPENGVGPIRAGGLDAPRVGVAVGLWERKGRQSVSRAAS